MEMYFAFRKLNNLRAVGIFLSNIGTISSTLNNIIVDHIGKNRMFEKCGGYKREMLIHLLYINT